MYIQYMYISADIYIYIYMQFMPRNMLRSPFGEAVENRPGAGNCHSRTRRSTCPLKIAIKSLDISYIYIYIHHIHMIYIYDIYIGNIGK